jgi:riboflavin kinase/FMN adenylyltransferase
MKRGTPMLRSEGFGSLKRLLPGPLAVTIGNFDGVHLGHRRLIAQAHAVGAPHPLALVVVTFEPHPAVILAPERAPARLTTHSEKLALLDEAGVAASVTLRSEPALFEQSAETFLRALVGDLAPRWIVEGPSFRFGRGRAGSVDTLRALAGALGYRAVIIEPVAASGGAAPVSSSGIRVLLSEGRVAEARAMLGRPHRITGLVGHGQRRGRTLGFPTANLEAVPQLVPGFGVYAAEAQLSDDRFFRAIVNVGPQPTFEQAVSRIEAHLLGFSGELHGQRLGLHFVSRLRAQAKFPSAEALRAQLREDAERARREAAVWVDGAVRGALPL